jgi:hypothetical protein
MFKRFMKKVLSILDWEEILLSEGGLCLMFVNRKQTIDTLRCVSAKNIRAVYAVKGLSQIPRLLTLLNRNEFSSTYGSFQRTFWLDKSDDFPNALPQFGTHALALAYNHKMPGNIYYRQDKIKKWCMAAMKYWTTIQHKDGSFDEFYPNERGWAGPTGFLLYAMLESYRIFKEDIPQSMEEDFLETCRKAAIFLGKHDEQGVLANHHAMAVLPVYSAYDILRDKKILKLFHERLNHFYTFVSKEGWSLEYDGADNGYLSATVSFLSKLWKMYQSAKLLDVIKKSIEFSSYFVYPNGYYGGSMGSRQTLHFYPHGYEMWAKKIPLAGAIADKMLIGLSQGKLVPPEIQADRYFLYRTPEMLLSYIDYTQRSKKVPVPYEQKPFTRFFPHGKYFIKKDDEYYLIANLAKGGVIKIFDKKNNLIYNDNGMIGKLDKMTVTSQWIDKDYKIRKSADSVGVSGELNLVPEKVFNPYKGLVFRSVMLTAGANTLLSYWLKGLIRNLLIFGNKKSKVKFSRTIGFSGKNIEINDKIQNTSGKDLKRFRVGDEFFVRYVPQSMFFQPVELDIKGFEFNDHILKALNSEKVVELKREVDARTGKIGVYVNRKKFN